jgi:NHLM bacteriocin system ABC transporter ATP-binding protein
MTASASQPGNIIPPFLLQGEQAWIIVSGAVDVFLVDLESGVPRGARRHAFRLEAGGALFGIAADDSGGAGLLACPLPGTQLDAVAGADVASDALGRWVAAFTEAIAGTPPGLTDHSDWRRLGAFHRVALEALVQDRADAERKERERWTVAAEQEAAAAGFALRQLASPMGTRPGPAGAGEEMGLASPLLQASNAVGKALGIRIRAPRGIQGAESVEAIARASGIRARRVALKGEWWREQSGPLLVFRDEDHRPAAVFPAWSGRYRLWDPVEDRTWRLDRKRAANLESFAWIFYRPFPPRKLGVWDLLVFGMRGAAADLTTITLMGIASGLLAVLLPVAIGLTFDSIIPGADRSGLLAVSLFLAIAAVASALFELTRNFAVLRLEGRMDAAMQAAVWDRLLGLPVPFFRDYTAGDLAMRSLAISQIREKLTGSTLESIFSGIFSAFSFALMFYYSWRLAVLGTALTAIVILAPLVVGVLQVRRLRELSEVHGRISGMVLQFVTGIAKLRVIGKELRAFTVWAREFTRQKRQATAVRKLSNGLSVFVGVFPLLCSGAIFYCNSLLVADGVVSLSTGAFLAFNAAFFQFLTAALALSSTVVSVLGIVPMFERARPILETLPETSDAKAEPGGLTGNIEISRAFFRYRPDTPLVLRDLSLSVRPGEFVALVGASGCGKSTVFRLLLGFEHLDSGAIHFDGQDLAGMNPQAVRRQIGVVLQNGQLQTGDIFENIAGTRPLTIDDAWAAARLAGLEDDIRDMPMGMHTVISEGGGGLSGGQRQRLMIARAIASRPRILLFDEATSALDNLTQAIVSRSLEQLEATRIVIAHRLSTIVKADRIFVLEAGRVVQSGSYAELIAQEGLFAKLAQRQLA